MASFGFGLQSLVGVLRDICGRWSAHDMKKVTFMCGFVGRYGPVLCPWNLFISDKYLEYDI